MKLRTKVVCGVVAATLSTGASAALYGFGPAEKWTAAAISALVSTVSSSISAFGASFGALMQFYHEQTISAVAVATKQEALSAQVISESNRNAAQQLVTAVKAQQQTGALAKAYFDYNGRTGQGYDPCGTIAKNKTLDMAFATVRATARDAVGRFDAAPGRLVPSTAQAMQDRLTTHRQKFCTAAEAEAGLCTVSAVPGGDTNAALLFEATSPGSLESQARTAYIQHVLGEPDEAIDRRAGQSPAGQTYMAVKNRKDAILSVAGYSLASIDAANTRSAEYGGRSPNEVLSLRVNNYFGGAEAEAWAGSMAGQTERGLIVEAAKIEGLSAWIAFERDGQAQRLEANVATLVIAAADRERSKVDAQHQQVVGDSVRGAIR